MILNIRQQETLLQVLESQVATQSSSLAAVQAASNYAPSSTSCEQREQEEQIRSQAIFVKRRSSSSDDCCADDEASIATCSTGLSFSSDEEEDDDASLFLSRRVSFSQELVTEVWTRPTTPTEDVPSLYYSRDETKRFRQEYRQERKETFEREDAAATSILFDNLYKQPSVASPSLGIAGIPLTLQSQEEDKPRSRHGISCVVVLHQDKLETLRGEDPWKANATSLLTGANASALTTLAGSNADVFFDDDSFWCGSITWY